jgi:hypothetical protein
MRSLVYTFIHSFIYRFARSFIRSSVCFTIIEVLHDHVRAAMLDGRTIEYLSPEELNSVSCKNISLFLPLCFITERSTVEAVSLLYYIARIISSSFIYEY